MDVSDSARLIRANPMPFEAYSSYIFCIWGRVSLQSLHAVLKNMTKETDSLRRSSVTTVPSLITTSKSGIISPTFRSAPFGFSFTHPQSPTSTVNAITSLFIILLLLAGTMRISGRQTPSDPSHTFGAGPSLLRGRGWPRSQKSAPYRPYTGKCIKKSPDNQMTIGRKNIMLYCYPRRNVLCCPQPLRLSS